MTIFSSFRSTVNPFQPRNWRQPIRMLVDTVTGAPVGLQNFDGTGPDGIWTPVDVTAAQISSPSAAMLADLNSTFRLNAAPWTRYRSNGTTLVLSDGGGGGLPLTGGTLTGLLYETAAVGIVAGTTRTQAGATALTAEVNRIDTSTAPAVGTTLGDGVVLMGSGAGLDITVINNSGNPIQIYGNGTDTIDGAAGSIGVTAMARSCVIFECAASGAWSSDGLAVGYSVSGLQTVVPQDNITAAGTGQSTATQLTVSINTIATAAAGTGVALPSSTNSAGLSVTVQNNGANPVQVYPFIGASDTINGIAAAIGVQLHNGSIGVFNCTAAGAWTVSSVSPIAASYNTNAATSGTTLTAANITGGQQYVVLGLTGANGAPANGQLPTVASMIAAMHSPTAGSSFELRIIQSSAQPWTITTNTGWTLTGSMAIPASGWRDFIVKMNSLTTATLQTVGSSAGA